MKVVINNCFGGFGLSEKAMRRYSVLKYGEDKVTVHGNGSLQYFAIDNVNCYELDRTDIALVQAVEELGKEASGDFSRLIIKEIPDGSEWEIEEYDGNESLRKPATYYY